MTTNIHHDRYPHQVVEAYRLERYNNKNPRIAIRDLQCGDLDRKCLQEISLRGSRLLFVIFVPNRIKKCTFGIISIHNSEINSNQ